MRTRISIVQVWKRRIHDWRIEKRCQSSITEVSISAVGFDSSSSSSSLNDQLVSELQPHFERQEPLLLRGAVSEAPALELWKSFDYWQSKVGQEMAKVEIGGSYASTGGSDGESSTAEIPVEGYLQYLKLFQERHGKSVSPDMELPASEEMVYMAQNDLFQNLYEDIILPDFCQDESNRVGIGRLYSVMLWLGPHSSVSPMHNDPLDNLFMQYVGRKRVLLFPPDTQVYAGHNGQQSNTSPIEPEPENESLIKQQYPLFDQTTGVSCEVGPGDALYIPSKWYHYVKSLDIAASVNIWWR
ncbi:unnamed protein product [Cylindrotheca closterium]|uniref:JmjC domain-containing protein n=1 Tax=Cylindrotheca closterium TaxID=2856 RepID=A0AAD2JKG2_9STRA|nr:unnamed protein product [Cylindrotheca closterium]